LIPVVDDLQPDFEIETQPSKAFKINFDKHRMIGFTDGIEAVIQAIFLILNTERYEHVIFSWDYGIELVDLFGQPIPFVLPELKRRITEALLQDDRIESVDNFNFEVTKRQVNVNFNVGTIFGIINAEKVVNV
jgi:hypothetical protein